MRDPGSHPALLLFPGCLALTCYSSAAESKQPLFLEMRVRELSNCCAAGLVRPYVQLWGLRFAAKLGQAREARKGSPEVADAGS